MKAASDVYCKQVTLCSHGSRYTLTSCSSGRGGEWHAAGGCAPGGGASGGPGLATLGSGIPFLNLALLVVRRRRGGLGWRRWTKT